MKIHPIITNNSLQNIFYVIEYGNKKAVLIDPSDSELTRNFLGENNLKLESIFITHEHLDHYSWVVWLGCDIIYASEITSDNMPIKVNNIVSDWEVFFEHENISIKSIFSPWHASWHMMFELCLGGIVYAIFVGDVLFPWWVWNIYSGDVVVLYDSIKKLERYRDDVLIYSGHDYMENNFDFIKKYFPEKAKVCNDILKKAESWVYFTNLWEEREINPFLACDKSEFIRLRELRNNW